MAHDDPSGPPPYNPGGAADSCFSSENSDDDFYTAVEKVKTAVEAQKAAHGAGKITDAKKHAAESVLHATDMLRHLQQKMTQSLADDEAGKTL